METLFIDFKEELLKFVRMKKSWKKIIEFCLSFMDKSLKFEIDSFD